MSNIYWIGIRESDLLATDSIFKGSVTFFGSGKSGNRRLFCDTCPRRDHNTDDPNFNRFYEESMRNIVDEDTDAQFMFYNQSMAQTLDATLRRRVICANKQEILSLMGHKMLCKLWLKEQVLLTPNMQLLGSELSFSALRGYFGGDAFVLQPDFSSGGHNTYVLTAENESRILKKVRHEQLYTTAPYFKNAIPINYHAVIYKDGFRLYPPSIQIVREEHEQLIYKGGDFFATKTMPEEILACSEGYARCICEKILGTGYLGVCGIDFIVVGQSVYFMEINPRFQASSAILNLALRDSGDVSVHQACMDAFAGKSTSESYVDVDIPYSFFTYTYEEKDTRFSQHIWKKYFSGHPVSFLLSDGYRPGISAETNAYLFRAVFPFSLLSIQPCGIRLAEALTGYPVDAGLSYMRLKTMLVNFGITISKDAAAWIARSGNLREANFSAIDITLPHGLVVNCPYHVGFSEYSPFELRLSIDHLSLYFFDAWISKAEICYESPLNEKKTQSGISYASIAFLATDRLRINYKPVCYYKSLDVGCAFCNLPNEGQSYTQEDIQEVIDNYLKCESFRHILIGGGSDGPDSAFAEVFKLISFLKQRTDKPLYLMSLPPRNLETIWDLYHAGITEVAFNIEIFDRSMAAQYMPGKGRIPLERYFSALSEAVKCLGNTGNVRSMLIIGFDPQEELLKGIEALCAMGVQPMLSVFRPLEGTPLEHWLPPRTEELLEIFSRASDICSRYGLALGPSCIACQNNTLSLPAPLYRSALSSFDS